MVYNKIASVYETLEEKEKMNQKTKRRKRRNRSSRLQNRDRYRYKNPKQILISVQVLIWIGVLVLLCLAFLVRHAMKQMETQETMVQKPVATATVKPAATPKVTKVPVPTPNPEEGIYTYLQGPKSWGQRLKWSGEWSETFYDGGSFGGFGCGLCCIANIYSSMTKYQCTPVDAYRYAKKKTGYSGGGAIDWGYMRRTLTSLGFDCGVRKKPSTYEAFQKEIAAGKCAIVLVSSANSTCYWKDTPGHYVTIFLYNKETDKIFLADSGDPDHNRHWVSLRKIYKSLKTASPWQYLYVKDYDIKNDNWKHKTADGNWVK